MDKCKDLRVVAERCEQAEKLFKQVYAAECCRLMKEWHEEREKRRCRGCAVKSQDKMEHECKGNGYYISFNAAQWADSSEFHDVVFKVEYESVCGRYMQALYKEFLDPRRYTELLSRFLCKAQREWFSEIYMMIKDGRINERSYVYDNVVVPQYYATADTLLQEEAEERQKIIDEGIKQWHEEQEKKNEEQEVGDGGGTGTSSSSLVVEHAHSDADDEDTLMAYLV